MTHHKWLHKIFMLGTRQYNCCAHPYDRTWTNERAVEIPRASSIIDEYRGSRNLECRNVLSHYLPVEHDVVDKYERAYGCINGDIGTFVLLVYTILLLAFRQLSMSGGMSSLAMYLRR